MNKPREVEELEKLCTPIVEYLKKSYNPYCNVIISGHDIKLVATRIEIPINKID
ncbi:hypothetical protein [Clostridium botulinum]|uniref:hypothetical protein n=1 Tax=Clostridium botulinum TaxID=1491 RepID=UPI0014753C81|nr:hypothetical protein [Clostridium botulinum]MBY6755509.1 hypothetical protein [Clostridium botulinum]MBY6766436.1 hypothetical protein [Clostridium botulinum]MBY6900360.1 hypothetical protein [Clostridium botulinum]MBY6914641.1 hypothetical protein [Clostridium botulinum]